MIPSTSSHLALIILTYNLERDLRIALLRQKRIVWNYNYQKYHKVKAKTQKAILDNGIDKPITLKTFGFFERVFRNKKMSDGSYERKAKGLMAYKKEPKYKFKDNLYVLVSPFTYSAGSELSNMLYTNKLGTFIGQETGGGYYGNTSGYESIPFGRGVIPHHTVIPTFEQYNTGVNASLDYALQLINDRKK